MYAERMIEDERVLVLECSGQLTADEFQAVHALVHERLDERGRRGLVLSLDGFEGYDGPAALLEDVRVDLKHRNDFDRIAIVGDQRWLQWGSLVAKLLTQGELRWFEQSAYDDAVRWAAQAA